MVLSECLLQAQIAMAESLRAANIPENIFASPYDRQPGLNGLHSWTWFSESRRYAGHPGKPHGDRLFRLTRHLQPPRKAEENT